MKISTDGRAQLAFVAVTLLFLMFGFITALVDPLVAAVKGIFDLSDAEAQLSASAFFLAYGVVSFPAALLIARFRFVPSILAALVTMMAGCLIMLLAANLAVYPIVLLGLFVLAGGITILQVAANPLAAALGDPRRSHLRLLVSQTFNSFGTFLGPLIGASLFLDGVEVKPGSTITAAVRSEALSGIDAAYLGLCALILLLAAGVFTVRRTISAAAPPPARHRTAAATLLKDALRSRWTLLGGLAIFIYVGAEVAIGTQMALFLNSDGVWGRADTAFAVPLLGKVMGSDGVAGVSLQEAGRAVAFYWGGAMVGRAFGSLLLGRIRAASLMAGFSGAAFCLCLYIVMAPGVAAGFVALSIGVFNSVMFPIIFTLTLERSAASSEASSGFLCTCITGGAVLPPLMGLVSGANGYAASFLVPAMCYMALLAFALAAGRVRVRHADVIAAPH